MSVAVQWEREREREKRMTGFDDVDLLESILAGKGEGMSSSQLTPREQSAGGGPFHAWRHHPIFSYHLSPRF